MGDYARITPTGGVLIDTRAWLAARTGGVQADLTDQLHTWARHHLHEVSTSTGRPHVAEVADLASSTATPRTGWPVLARTWCEHAGHQVGEPGLIVHQRTRLDTGVWVLPATTNDGDGEGGGRVAVIGTGDHPPVVYVDTTTDPWAWCDADAVTITCPAGHWWVWRSGRELLTAAGRPATLTGVFGTNLEAPFSSCPTCSEHRLGRRAAPCRCDGTPWIVCPVCGQRCRLSPPVR
jgi:hypothetical protein